MFSIRVQSFLRDESGAYTIWSLIWFSLYVGLGGLAVDMTDAYRNQTLLQSTADASALAGVMALSEGDDEVATAVVYSTDNMYTGVNGNVLKAAEVFTGNWDTATRTFSNGVGPENAVRVVTRRDNANNNPVATNFLRIASLFGIPLDRWNISVEAIALRYVPECLNDGFTAENRVDTGSNNTYVNNICIHGQNVDVDPGQNYSVDIQNGNFFEPGVQVSMPDLSVGLPSRQNLCTQNTGLCEAKTEGDAWPKDMYGVGDTIAGLQAADPEYLPDFMVTVDLDGVRSLAPGVTTVTGSSLPGTLVANTIYVISCNGQISLPGVPISNVVVVADCRIHSSSGTDLQDVVLASTHSGGAAAISMAANSILGRPDDCTDGGGVELYTLGDVHIAAGGAWHGLRVVAAGAVQFTSRNVNVHGISVQAYDIDFSSNNTYGLCAGGVPGRFADHFRLVL